MSLKKHKPFPAMSSCAVATGSITSGTHPVVPFLQQSGQGSWAVTEDIFLFHQSMRDVAGGYSGLQSLVQLSVCWQHWKYKGTERRWTSSGQKLWLCKSIPHPGARSVPRDLNLQWWASACWQDVFFFFCKYVFGGLKSLLLTKGRRLSTQLKPGFLPFLIFPASAGRRFGTVCPSLHVVLFAL